VIVEPLDPGQAIQFSQQRADGMSVVQLIRTVGDGDQ